ncbi:hypothetical protein HHI36_018396 [Cryptolaemus montrouzieri]|uniref:MOSC domain-containing protein n=1 Tax=Cryptolaemus montrouzieri TaxID=559131 RepID=A0ABD2NZT5_9CUCU
MGSKLSSTLVSTAVITVSATFCIYLIRKKKRENRIPTEWKKIGNAKRLYIFPLKSGHYIEIDAAECTEVGFRLLKSANCPLQLRDRSFVVYGENDGQIRSGRAVPSLVRIEISVHDENHIALDAPQMRTLYVRIPEKNENNTKIVSVWSGETIETIDCGDEAARWLSHHIVQKDSGYRLGYHDALVRRNLVRHQERMKFYEYMTDAATGLFSDVSSVLIVNQASYNDYHQKVPTANVTPLNFRPNIVVYGPDIKPYDEDNWKWLKIGENVILKNVKECTRCVFTTVDPETGKRNQDKEPLSTLTKYRLSRSPEDEPIMGIHLEVKKAGIIKTDDPVYIG